MVNENACDFDDYESSESAEFSFPPKRWMFQSGFFIGCSDEAEAPAAKAESVDRSGLEKGAKVIPLFEKNDPITTHPTKKAHSD